VAFGLPNSRQIRAIVLSVVSSLLLRDDIQRTCLYIHQELVFFMLLSRTARWVDKRNQPAVVTCIGADVHPGRERRWN
jgi:hypothetical protein